MKSYSTSLINRKKQNNEILPYIYLVAHSKGKKCKIHNEGSKGEKKEVKQEKKKERPRERKGRIQRSKKGREGDRERRERGQSSDNH